MKKILVILLFAASAFSDTLLLEYADDCCEKNSIEVNLISSNSVEGISMKGVLDVKMIGDMLNTITGPALLTFTRESDDKAFIIKAPIFGFKPNISCINNYFADDINKCLLENPIKYNIDKNSLSPLNEYGVRDPMEYVSLSNNILRVASLFTGDRGRNEYEVYKLINNKDEFRADFMYTIPQNAIFNSDGTFTYKSSGGAAVGAITTMGKVDDKWIILKEVYYECWDPKYSTYPQVYKVYEYDRDIGKLMIALDQQTCPEDF